MAGSATALIVDGELARAATLAAALRQEFWVIAASSLVAGLPHVAGRLALLVVDVHAFSAGLQSLLSGVRARHPACRIIGVNAGPPLRSDALRRPFTDALLEPPWDIVDVLRHAAALFPNVLRFQRTGDRVRGAISRISRSFPGNVSLTDLARELHVSPSHLAHLFPLEMGITVKEFLVAARIEAAKQLLRESLQSLDEVAARTGFYDASHLTRMFAREVGQRPGAYRRVPDSRASRPAS